MEQKTNTLSVPYSYARCYNEQCRQAENCLRRMAALYDTADYPFITILNPFAFRKRMGIVLIFKKRRRCVWHGESKDYLIRSPMKMQSVLNNN